MSLSRDEILNVKDFAIEEVKVPEWDGSVFVRSISGFSRDSFEREVVNSKDNGYLINIRAKYAAMTICDKDGNNLFTEADIEQLGKKSGAALDRIFEAAREINKMSEEDVEEMEKK